MVSGFKIGTRPVGPGHPVYIVAELSANHGQDYEQAVRIVEAAHQAGADAVKLQTYTADTLRDLRAERGEDVDMYFITGADALAQILTWRDVDSIFDLAHFVGCTRPGVDLESPVIAQLPPDRVTLMEVPALAISSTACRLRVQEHQPIWYLVPDGIVQYIAKRGLYQS